MRNGSPIRPPTTSRTLTRWGSDGSSSMGRLSCGTVNVCLSSPVVSCFRGRLGCATCDAGQGVLKPGTVDRSGAEETRRAHTPVRNHTLSLYAYPGFRSCSSIAVGQHMIVYS